MNHRWAGSATSAVVHVLAGLAMLAFTRAGVPPGTPKTPRALTFVTVLSPLDVPRVVTPPLALPPLVAEVAERTPILEPLPAPPIRLEPPPEPAPVRPEPPPPEPRHEAVPVEVRQPPAPVVRVGNFAASNAPSRNAEIAKPVQSAGFDAPGAVAPEVKTAAASVGAFDRPAGVAQPGTDRPNRVVGDAGFGRPVEQVRTSQSAREIRSTAFDAPAAPPSPASPPPPRPSRIDMPVEIVSKPTPIYTPEARTLKVEGEVLLEVEFAASGDVRVLQVVRGLGHGLDEAATRAAEGIRFKPARSGGQPVDFRATVHIVFRLA